ncbi:MAG: substrate-binding domain-containing protein [Planctomycetota bacterium]|nr:substrate-binding domain-containing protein [Planctomycetota bacterium]
MLRVLPILLAAALSTSCGDSNVTGTVKRIAVIPKGTTHSFWRAVHCGAARADQDFADIEIVWKAPLGENDMTQQVALLESFVAEGYDGICLAPLDTRGLVGGVRNAIDRGVAVLIFDSPLENCDLRITSTVATDNLKGGELAGHELARRIGGVGDVVVLRYMAGSYSTNLREQGCLAALKLTPGIRVITDDVYAGPDESSAVAVSERLLASLGDRIVGVFCSNESTASGFLTALARDPRGIAGRIKVVAFDTSKRIVDALESGSLAATVVQNPVKMGYAAVSTMRAHLRGEKTESVVETGETLVTRETMFDPEVRALLEPPEQIR